MPKRQKFYQIPDLAKVMETFLKISFIFEEILEHLCLLLKAIFNFKNESHPFQKQKKYYFGNGNAMVFVYVHMYHIIWWGIIDLRFAICWGKIRTSCQKMSLKTIYKKQNFSIMFAYVLCNICDHVFHAPYYNLFLLFWNARNREFQGIACKNK